MTKFKSEEPFRTSHEQAIRADFLQTFKDCPIPDVDILSNLGLFISSKNLSRILFMDFLYRQIIDVPGVVMEFGTRWGQNLALFAALRGIYEPFDRVRKLIGFDTFTGFPELNEKDKTANQTLAEGSFSTTPDYVEYLNKVMEYQEQENPLGHIKKFDIRAGDASEEIARYLAEFPETIISLAYFDFDLYEPTKNCLEAIRSHLVKGSILGFDELNDPTVPGETLALKEVMGLNNISLRRWRYVSRTAYFVVE